MTIVRRSNRINALTNRRSPRISKHSYGSRFDSCHTNLPKNSNGRRALKVKKNTEKQNVVLKVLRSRPIIKKECYRSLVNKKNTERKHQEKAFSTPQRTMNKAIISPPPIRRSNRKRNNSNYFSSKCIDFDLYQ